MSNVYILEPLTSGKVLLKTTVGDIDIELWTKETPKTCRNFIQLCLEGYYNGLIFHRVVKGFIAQGGDPNGDGTGGESIYGEPFKDEFHQRLKFVRRGLIAMANAGQDDNSSQFFFTLAATPELQNKHTIFGKVTGDTLFNMLKLEEGLIKDERPVYPHKILKAEVLSNPFDDIEPRVTEESNKKVEKKKKDKRVGVKDFKLLSFGEEAEEDEEETAVESKKYLGKGKSTHDVLNDPKLSSEVAEELKAKQDGSDTKEQDDGPSHEEQLESIRKKLKSDKKEKKDKPTTLTSFSCLDEEDEDTKRKRKREEIQNEIRNVKKEYQQNKLKKDVQNNKEGEEEKTRNELFKEYDEEFNKYKEIKKTQLKRGAGREEQTLALLAKFKQKLNTAKEKHVEEDQSETKDEIVDNDLDREDWLAHKLNFELGAPILAKDANTKDDDWYEVFDPRNPLNKRRRGDDGKGSSKSKI